MTEPVPRRSVLYVPGSNTRALDKSAGLDADVLVFDLEDGVAPAAKVEARDHIARSLAGGHRAGERLVRINGLDTAWGLDDVAWARELPIDGLMVPKVESATMVRRVDGLVRERPLTLWILVETARGVLALEGVASASPRIAALVMGTSDLTKDMRARHVPSRAPLAYALSRTVTVARAYGLDAIDGVHLALDDEAGFERSCLDSVALGFDGRSLIHPRTIATANRVYGPSAEEVEAAERVVEAYRAAEARGEGVAVHEGALIERLHADAAERVRALARAIGARRGGS